MHDTERANYILAFWKTSEEDFWYTDEIEYGTDANTFRNRIRGYYTDGNTVGAEPEVTLSCRDYNATEIDCSSDSELIRDYVYLIVVPRLISGPSCNDI